MLAALISGRAGPKHAKKPSAEISPDLISATSVNAETHERVAKGTALSVFKKGRAITKSSDNNKMHSPPTTRRES